MTFDRAALLAQLKADEGFRGYIYDDATGKPLHPGMMLQGRPTAGYGLALDVDPLSEPEAASLLATRMDSAVTHVQASLAWVSGLSDGRQRAIYDMAYQLGVAGLLTFTTFLGLMEAGSFEAAADDLTGTEWHKQAGDRSLRIEAQIREG